MSGIMRLKAIFNATLDGSEMKSVPIGINMSTKVYDILHDIAMLISYKKLIITKSSFAFWGAFLSNATEVDKLFCFV